MDSLKAQALFIISFLGVEITKLENLNDWDDDYKEGIIDGLLIATRIIKKYCCNNN